VPQPDAHSIRNTSFTLAVNGYNPEQVDELLVDLAAAVDADGSVDPVTIDPSSLELVPAGYDIDEVNTFFSEFAGLVPDGDGEDLADPVAAEAEDALPAPDADQSDDPSADGASAPAQEIVADGHPEPEAAPATEEAARDAIDAPVPSVQELGNAAQGTLSHAVERTKQTVVELEVFLGQQFELAKAACHEAVAHTREDCEQTMKTARNVAQAALTMTEDAAGELRGQASEALDRISQDFERQLGFTQRTFQQNLEQCRGQITAELERLLASARSRTDGITADIDAVQVQVEEALADARSVLTAEARRAA
jgi:DivIVA domain-containing protein